MIITLKPLVVEKLCDELVAMDVISVDKDNSISVRSSISRHKYRGYREDDLEIDLAALTKKETQRLLIRLEVLNVHGTRIIIADIKKYLKASEEGVATMRARTCRQAAWMFEFFFKDLPHHMIFSFDKYGGRSHSGYYVGDVDYQPEVKANHHNDKRPEHCTLYLWHVEKDERRRTAITLYRSDCVNMTCFEILDSLGYIPESPKLYAKLVAETERYYEVIPKIGKQYRASGIGVKDLDDALSRDDDRWSSRSNEVQLDKFGETRVVVDILHERDDESSRSKRRESRCNREPVDPYRWHNWNLRFHTPSEDEIVRHLEADDDTVEPCDVDIPVHPLVPCYDLRRHVRLRVHVNNMHEYEYNKKAAESLVLPDRDWRMVNLLIDHSTNTFKDIVDNKGRSMNILSVGKPGTGKTATAEVFAEFKERPLYTIQCGQLGMTADDVEGNLSIIMARANRWNAVLLLDEADVYIRKRGNDLNQNAIVGSFLRVLEYASCILFMTTNLEDSVDDAITSRCIAKLHYGPPGATGQARIWRILADLNNIDMTDKEIDKVTKAYPNLTGRDVKNLLKLASFVSARDNKALDAKAVEYAMQFKPTE